jgi:hypothetical protein
LEVWLVYADQVLSFSQYAIRGNPIDAYKFFEYNYQEDFMAHHYLPDHAILAHVPKPKGYTQPCASAFEFDKRNSKVRLRMACAQDQGLDVLDVLFAEHKIVLLGKGLGRGAIEERCALARGWVEEERRDPTGKTPPWH